MAKITAEEIEEIIMFEIGWVERKPMRYITNAILALIEKRYPKDSA